MDDEIVPFTEVVAHLFRNACVIRVDGREQSNGRTVCSPHMQEVVLVTPWHIEKYKRKTKAVVHTPNSIKHIWQGQIIFGSVGMRLDVWSFASVSTNFFFTCVQFRE